VLKLSINGDNNLTSALSDNLERFDFGRYNIAVIPVGGFGQSKMDLKEQ
jgi:hypothetical protein